MGAEASLSAWVGSPRRWRACCSSHATVIGAGVGTPASVTKPAACGRAARQSATGPGERPTRR